jgi:hypothetical protein
VPAVGECRRRRRTSSQFWIHAQAELSTAPSRAGLASALRREQRSAGQTNWVGEALGDLVEEEKNLWIPAVGDKVAALGGHLELIAVFPDETVTLLKEPGLHTSDSDDTAPDDDSAEPG